MAALNHLVSVVIPTYNSEQTINRAIRSVKAQTYKDWEIIVVDDGSTDNTVRVVSTWPEVRLITQKREGVSVARNKGVQVAGENILLF